MRAIFHALTFVLPVCGLVRDPHFLAKRQEDCPVRETVESQLLTTVVGQPVVLSTVVRSNTVIPSGPFGGPITITNGPTTLVTTSIAFTTLIYTRLQTLTSTTPAAAITSFTTGPSPGTTTIPASGTNPPEVVITQVPVTSFTTGPVDGTSIVPGDSTDPPVVIITQVPITSFTTGPVDGTAIIPPSGTNPPEVIITQVPVTSFTTGPVDGTSIVPGDSTRPPVVIVTTVPPAPVTSFTTGPIGGTTTIPADGTTPPIVVITQVPTTTFTTGPIGGTTTVPGTGTDPPVIIITQVPVTSFTDGPVPGTSTVPGDDTEPPVIIITQVPITSFTPGPIAGISTIPRDGTIPPVIIITQVLNTITTISGSTSATATVPTTDAGGAPTTVVVVIEPTASGACPVPIDTTTPSCTGGLQVDAYANSFVSAEAYGVPDSSAGPDYYIGTTPYASGQISSLSVPNVPNPGGDYVTVPGGPEYHPEVTAQYAGFTYNPNNSTLVFSGFFRPPVAGTYTICTSADNLNTLYDGSESAFSCGTSEAVRDATPTVAGLYTGLVCADVEYEANQFYPIRSVFGMNGLPSFLTTTITAPGGAEPLDLEGLVFPPTCANLT